jgi:hypothetical protein
MPVRAVVINASGWDGRCFHACLYDDFSMNEFKMYSLSALREYQIETKGWKSVFINGVHLKNMQKNKFSYYTFSSSMYGEG